MGNAVLIVDDDVNAQIIAETLLRLRGLDVRVTNQTAEAVDSIAHADVGVVMVDLNMSGMNGLEGFRRLRAAGALLETPPRILVVTDRHAPEVERFSQRIGADAVLRKPLDPGQLIATVERLLEAVCQPAVQAARNGAAVSG